MAIKTIGIAFATLTLISTFQGSVEAAPAEKWRCSQLYATAHETCIKRNNRERCEPVLSSRNAVCMKTGCWRNSRGNTCGYTRL
jgi:hypothetical protein